MFYCILGPLTPLAFYCKPGITLMKNLGFVIGTDFYWFEYLSSSLIITYIVIILLGISEMCVGETISGILLIFFRILSVSVKYGYMSPLKVALYKKYYLSKPYK